MLRLQVLGQLRLRRERLRGEAGGVAILSLAVQDLGKLEPLVALAAPTGKAANRLEEALRDGLARLPATDTQ